MAKQFKRYSSTLRTTLKTGEQDGKDVTTTYSYNNIGAAQDADGYAELAMLINACQAHPAQKVKQAITDLIGD